MLNVFEFNCTWCLALPEDNIKSTGRGSSYIPGASQMKLAPINID